MEKKKMIFAEEQEEYIYSVIGRFIQELGELLEIEVITEENYVKSICQKPLCCDVLVVKEEWYQEDLRRQNIHSVFLLSEKEEEDQGNIPGIKKIYKYSSLNEIFLRIYSGAGLSGVDRFREKGTEILAVYSAVGGCGKTTMALGLCCALYRHGQRILYLNLESIQNFDYFLKDNTYVAPEASYQAYGPDWENYVKTQGFDYLPPRKQSAVASDLSYRPLLNALDQARTRNIYDFYIMELPSELDAERIQVLSKAHKVVLVTRQDELSMWKTERFLENIDYSDQDKFLFVSNSVREICLNSTYCSQRFCLQEKLADLSGQKGITSVEEMLQSSVFDKLVYLVL